MPNKDELLAEAKDNNVEVPENATKAEIQELLDKNSNAQEKTPAEVTAEDVEKLDSTVNDGDASEPDAKSDGGNDEAKKVETDLGSSEEEAAAARAGVDSERLENPKQNREPKNEFEQSNQKVTEEERQAAQEVSDITTKAREDEAPTPNESAKADAERTAGTNQSSDIASAIAQGFSQSKKDSFKLEADAGVNPRFTLVKNSAGEVMIRENETGTLSKLQLESLEEKEASVQGQKVEEL